VEPNPAEQERGDSNSQPADQANEVGESAPWAAIEAAERRAGRRRTLLILAAFLLAICLVGGVVGYVWYDRATQVDRSTPVIVVFQYVNAVFELRDDGRAELYECKNATSRSALHVVLDDLEEREQRYGIRITVSATNYSSTVEGATALVEADLLIDVPEADGKLSRSSQRWRFELQDEGGWRVCDAQRAAQ
jgi:hypothetical protein